MARWLQSLGLDEIARHIRPPPGVLVEPAVQHLADCFITDSSHDPANVIEHGIRCGSLLVPILL